MSDKKPREPLIGFMVIEDYVEDYSEWGGQITFPDPTGANLHWEKPIKMIEFSAYEALKKENQRLNNQGAALDYTFQQQQKQLEAARGEIERLKEFEFMYKGLEK